MRYTPCVVPTKLSALGLPEPDFDNVDFEVHVDPIIYYQLQMGALRAVKVAESRLWAIMDKIIKESKIMRETCIPISVSIWCLIVHYGLWLKFEMNSEQCTPTL
jgi:hypothetical protein